MWDILSNCLDVKHFCRYTENSKMMHQRNVHEYFVYATLALALTAGFGCATILVVALASHLPLLAQIELAPWSLVCLVAGIVLRALCQPLTAIAQASMPQGSLYDALGRFGTMVSALSDSSIFPISVRRCARADDLRFRHSDSRHALGPQSSTVHASRISPEAGSISTLDSLCHRLGISFDWLIEQVFFFATYWYSNRKYGVTLKENR